MIRHLVEDWSPKSVYSPIRGLLSPGGEVSGRLARCQMQECRKIGGCFRDECAASLRNQNDKLSISIFAVEDAQQGHGDDL